mmetsp:Transcript_58254/g.85381  ORF Transcript_58254/g.85381 Transcript_58254/m.85381 type:complete len:97 (+) Transcript_58254:196-486(+)
MMAVTIIGRTRNDLVICMFLSSVHMYTRARCNKVQHAATHCNIVQHMCVYVSSVQLYIHTTTHYNTLQHAATHLQHSTYVLVCTYVHARTFIWEES